MGIGGVFHETVWTQVVTDNRSAIDCGRMDSCEEVSDIERCRFNSVLQAE